MLIHTKFHLYTHTYTSVYSLAHVSEWEKWRWRSYDIRCFRMDWQHPLYIMDVMREPTVSTHRCAQRRPTQYICMHIQSYILLEDIQLDLCSLKHALNWMERRHKIKIVYQEIWERFFFCLLQAPNFQYHEQNSWMNFSSYLYIYRTWCVTFYFVIFHVSRRNLISVNRRHSCLQTG